MSDPTILVIGTCDTKADELLFIRRAIEDQDAGAIVMDVGVLSKPPFAPDISNDDVAAAAGKTIAEIAASGDENEAMTAMALGAARLAARLCAEGRIGAMIALGGSMGTDLALDVAAALPIGVPKVVVSTIAFSHLLPPERMTPDLTMILWAGGLYGLNDVCRATLAQASGAVVGAARAAIPLDPDRPLVGMTSLASSCLSYMKRLKPALESRGYELAVFHCTGMGGRAFEALAAQKRFVAVMDLCLQEVANEALGSVVTAGADRLENAGRAGIPQIVAPGACDMVDFQAWNPIAAAKSGERSSHAHNRLIASLATTPDERRALANVVAYKLAEAKGPVKFLLPLQGVEEWDKPGAPMHDPEGLAALVDGLRSNIRQPAELVELDCHINDDAFADAVMDVFDRWVAAGVVSKGRRG